ncbi:MAG TPA: TetR/AcrR family transcriptional regulator [Aldersonia sp.]
MAVAYEKADVRRRQLVAAARAVLGRDGMGGGTLRAVAAEAGVPLGTVHYIFKTKEQLLRAVLEDVLEQVGAVIAGSPRGSADFGTSMRSSAVEVWSKLVEQDTGEQIMQYELTIWALRTAGMEDLARWQYQLYIDTLTVRWQKAAARAKVTLAASPEQLARLLLAGIDGLILQYLALRDAERAKADIDALVEQLVRYATDD